MKEIGSRTVYLNERLTIGLAPEGLKEYITQRGRWCLGFMQIFRGRSGPFSMQSRLDFIDRLSLVDSFLHLDVGLSGQASGLIVPGRYLVFGIRAVHADLLTLLRYFLPFFVWHSLTIAWISRGRSLAIISDVSQFIASPAICQSRRDRAVETAGAQVQGDGQRRRPRPALRRMATASLLRPALVLTLAGIVIAFLLHLHGDSIAYGGLALAWSWYNDRPDASSALSASSSRAGERPSASKPTKRCRSLPAGNPRIDRLAEYFHHRRAVSR